MRKLLALSLPLLILSCTSSNEESPSPAIQDEEPTVCNCDDLQIDTKYNWFYLSDRKKPFNGTCFTYTTDSVKILERSYNTGKVHGKVLEWFPNGQPKITMEFDMNMQTGEMKQWAEDGELEYHALYDHGKMDTLIYKRVHYVTD